MRKLASICLLALVGQTVLAIEPIPKESGWNGYLSPALSAMTFRDNQVAGAGRLEIGNERIESLTEEPEKQSAASLSMAAEVGYAFTEQGLYVFLGNRLEDFLRLDNGSALGARLEVDGVGILEASALFSSIPTEVWADPFLTGADRVETDRTSRGGRLGLADILGTRLETRLTVRSMEVEDERSGESLDLSDAERALLARSGDFASLELLYPWMLNERHLLVPAVEVGLYDADGEAMSRTGGSLMLTHAYRQGRYRLVSNLSLRQARFDEDNPVFGKKQDEDEVMLSTTGFYAKLFDIPGLSGMASLLYAKRNAQITFYDGEATVVSLGVLYNF